jgi:disulfide bond formation protein DsbB
MTRVGIPLTLDGASLSRIVPLALVAVGVGGLLAALIAQHVFGLEPCVLCLWQRVPYGAVAVLGGLALVVPGITARRVLVGVAAAVLLAGAAVAFYHVGVEEHWWETAIPGCAAPDAAAFLESALSPEELERLLAAKPPKPCDEVDWRLFGLSMAGFNAIGSLALAAATLVGRARMTRGSPA